MRGSVPSDAANTWPPSLRRALIKVQPDYFGWPPDQQLRYRVDLPDADREALITDLLRAHGHRRPVATAKLESNGRISLAVQHQVNHWLQPLIGIGEDNFSLNEHFAHGCSLLNFETLLAYDEDDHDFQEEARVRDFPGHVKRPYAGDLHGTWARCLTDGQLTYLNLSMAAWYVYGAAESAAIDEVKRLVPHRYVAGPAHGKKTPDGMSRWDQHVDAGGHEGLLDELQRRVRAYESLRSHALLSELKDRAEGSIWFIDHPYPVEPKAQGERNLLIVFSHPLALANVRFTSFLRDCTALEQPRDELSALEAREVNAMLSFVAEQHDHLLRNFDPKLTTLRKRKKVLFYPNALRDLEDR